MHPFPFVLSSNVCCRPDRLTVLCLYFVPRVMFRIQQCVTWAYNITLHITVKLCCQMFNAVGKTHTRKSLRRSKTSGMSVKYGNDWLYTEYCHACSVVRTKPTCSLLF